VQNIFFIFIGKNLKNRKTTFEKALSNPEMFAFESGAIDTEKIL